MADSTTLYDLITESQADKEVTANALFDATSLVMAFARRQSTADYLVWGYYGGRIDGVLVANGTVTLTASSINYIVVHRQTGAVTVSTSGANWCTPQTYARLYKVTCGAVQPSSWLDYRFGRFGVLGHSFGGSVPWGRVELPLVLGDAATTLTTGTGKVVSRPTAPVWWHTIRASLATESSSGIPTFDINDGGVSMLPTKVTIDASERTNTTAATPHLWAADSQHTLDDAEISADCDVAGTGAKGPIIWLIGERGVGDPCFDLTASGLTLEGPNTGTSWSDVITGNGITWTANGAATTSTAQSLNSVSALFASSSTLIGSGQSLESNSSSVFNVGYGGPWCMEIWGRFTSIANTPYLIEIGFSDTNQVIVYQDSGALKLYTANGGAGAVRISGGSISTATWYFAEAAYDGTNTYLWLDGALLGSISTAGLYPSANMLCSLGRNAFSGASAANFSGHVQRFRWTRGLARRTSAYTRPVKPWAAY